MTADFSRVRLNPLLDYAGVELKQGGVLLDADANELVAIMDRRLRALASDALGRATVSSTTPNAFKISVAPGTLLIDKGRLYVDGLLAENHGAASADPAKRVFDGLMAEPAFADKIDYARQPYLPNPPALPTSGRHLVYLDVWDRDVTHLEEPNLVESAVAVETTSRVQTVWQVRVLADDVGVGVDCGSPDASVPGWAALIAPSTGVLTTGVYDVPPSDDPCELPPTGGYRGLENQLYRVEIHDAGQPGGTAAFKWSRENASVGSRVTSVISGAELELETLGRDDVLGLKTGDWVEIVDDWREFAQRPGEMRRITVDVATKRVSFAPTLPPDMLPQTPAFPDSNFPKARHMRVRRWDQKGKVFRTNPSGPPVQVQDLDAAGSTGVIAVPAAGVTLLLENGVTVSFASTGAKGFKAGDHWEFAARTADASVELLVAAPPRGVHHHYARLGFWNVAAGTVSDCRNPWPPAVEGHDCGCTACVTVESHASGQFTIQDAVNKVGQTGGTVCIGPGQYALREPVRLANARSLRIRGQGPSTVVTAEGGVFALQDCFAVAIENLAIVSFGRRSAVSVRTAIGLSLRQLVIAVSGGIEFLAREATSRAAAISLQGVVAGAKISENAIFAPVAILANDPFAPPPFGEDQSESFLLAADLAIEENVFWCQRQAVTLNGPVLHMMSARIARNEAIGCSEFAVSALGVSLPGASMMVRENTLNVTGSGIICGVDGVWIEGNKLFNSATGAAANNPTVGVSLPGGFLKTGDEECQILANQISGFAAAGILVDASPRALIVKLNIIEDCGAGVFVTARTPQGSVSIENNSLRSIGPRAGPDGASSAALVIGVGLVGADAATIAGNTIRTLGAQAIQSPLIAAILTFNVLRPHVTGNEISEVAPPGEFLGAAAGIMLLAPYMQFDVSRNHVERDAGPSRQGGGGNWSALVAGDFEQENRLTRVANLAAVSIDARRTLVFDRARIHLRAFGEAAAPPPPPRLARGTALGNVVTARGGASAVDLSAAGECLFNDNRIEQIGGSGRATVRVMTRIAIVSANRVRGGRVSIELDGAQSAAVLGNITTGEISVPGGVNPPWDALNLRA